jgi:hypothetical protein
MVRDRCHDVWFQRWPEEIIINNHGETKQERDPPFMGKVGACDLCDNYFIAFADLRFKLPIHQWYRGNVSYDVIFLLQQCQTSVPDCLPLLV